MLSSIPPFVRNPALVAKRGGLTVFVAPFVVDDFSHGGGVLTLVGAGTWYVGVDLFSQALIALPRLGHRGWVPVAKVVASASAITSIVQITPVLPKSRLPRTLKKILSGKAISVLVMGSSLAEGATSNVNIWGGMLFGSTANANKYKLPASSITYANYALGGTPNQYQLAQLGRAGALYATDFSQAGYSAGFSHAKKAPSGRSSMLNGVDLVVITCLANGGDYRLEVIEPIVRRLRESGVEVILTTDNPQGAPFTSLSQITAAALYTDGPEVMRIADLYGVELADTAAYVAEATLRYPGTIYSDTIHMASGAPNGRTGTPSGGHEVWARAIRSLLHVDATTYGTVVTTYDFAASTQGFSLFTLSSTVAWDAGNARLSITKNTASTAQWGAWSPVLSPIKSGDTVRVQGTVVRNGNAPLIGLQGNTTQAGAGWASTTAAVSADGAFDVTLTATRDNNYVQVLFFGNNDNAANGSVFYVDDVTITVNSTYVSTGFEIFKRGIEQKNIPPCRIVSDLKTPGDAFVILPMDERRYVISDANKGTLGAHPLGASSFARRFSSAVGSTQDLLTATATQRIACAADGAVGFSLIYYSVNGDPEVVFDVYKNNAFIKTITIPAQTLSREIYQPLITPTDLGINSVVPQEVTLDLRVTSGTLRVAAIVALTFDMDLVHPEAITRIGSWTASKVSGGAPGMLGFGTDTLNDHAYVKCPKDGNRVSWVISSKPNSKQVNTWSGRTSTLAEATTGVNHIRAVGAHIGPGETHYIQLNETQSNVDQSTNGYGLHIGGAYIINDR